MWNLSRGWMYDRIDPYTKNISDRFLAGVDEFMNFASKQSIAESSGGRFYCPCIKCKNSKLLQGHVISKHLLSKGFMSEYYVWTEHGEDYGVFGLPSSLYTNANYASGSHPTEYDGGNVYASGSQPTEYDGEMYLGW